MGGMTPRCLLDPHPDSRMVVSTTIDIKTDFLKKDIIPNPFGGFGDPALLFLVWPGYSQGKRSETHPDFL